MEKLDFSNLNISDKDLDDYLLDQEMRYGETSRKQIPPSHNLSTSWKKLKIIDPRSVGLDVKKVNIDYGAPISCFFPPKADIENKDEFQIRSSELFIPTMIKHPGNLILLILYHGTWGQKQIAL